jgi:hypothetical protein
VGRNQGLLATTEIRTTREARHCWPFAGMKKPGACPGFEVLVEVSGIEPLASTLRTSRSPN